MSDNADAPDLAFIGRQHNGQERMLDEIRAMDPQHNRVAGRVRALEEKAS